MAEGENQQDAGGTRVGFIGLGRMGAPMAANLLRAGHQVQVWNRSAERCEPLVAAGAVQAASPKALAAWEPQVLCLCVTNHPDVEAVLFGAEGVMAGARPGLMVADHSTLLPAAAEDFARRLKPCGVVYLDAPVSGGDSGARAGTLSIMVGGERAAFERAEPVLAAMGKKVCYLGPSGAGQACKACNQIAVMGALLGVCEALAVARRSDLDLQTVIEMVGGGAGGSWQMTHLGPKIAAGDHAPGFKVRDALKDLAIVGETARSMELPLAIAPLAEMLLRSVAVGGGAELGTQALARAFEQLGDFSFVRPAEMSPTHDG